MKPSNYVNFSVVFGFFLGLAFGIIKFDEPENILFWTIVSTLGFYLITLLSVSIYTWFVDFDNSFFDKFKLEKKLQYFDNEFDLREKEANNIRNYIKNSDFLENSKPISNTD